jgi:hypothetical protein
MVGHRDLGICAGSDFRSRGGCGKADAGQTGHDHNKKFGTDLLGMLFHLRYSFCA